VMVAGQDWPCAGKPPFGKDAPAEHIPEPCTGRGE
jgi:hypothetical protein